MDVTPGALTIPAAAAYMSLSVREVDRLITAGELTPRGAGEKGGKRLILRADLDAYLARLPHYEPKRQAS